ncbi:MAG: hypothetical protein J6568_02875 [Snodgrassella sp.]|nr:hypothetical protein [Snodgrassella sp.]
MEKLLVAVLKMSLAGVVAMVLIGGWVYLVKDTNESMAGVNIQQQLDGFFIVVNTRLCVVFQIENSYFGCNDITMTYAWI